MDLIDILDAVPIPIAYRIAFITNFYREPLLRRIEREHGVIRPEWTVLICLVYRDGICARDICAITEQPSNTVSRAVASLEAKGLVRSRPDRSDGRRRNLSLTDAGRALHDRLMEPFVQAEAQMTASLTPAEKTQLVHLLDKIARDTPRWQREAPYREA